MRNLKKALSLALASVMLLGMMVVGTSAASYDDVDSADNVEAIEVMKMAGIMAGDENGNFNPDKGVTRNEMAVIMANLMDLDIEDYKGSSPFTDLAAWAEPYVAACYANGIVSGTSTTTYGGNDTVTTAQAALMLMKALGYFQYGSDFENDWMLATVKKGSEIKLFDGVDTGAAAALTRNEVAQLALNALETPIVTATVSGNNTQIEAGDVNITVTANVTYNKKVDSTELYRDAISNTGYIELGEDLFEGELTKTPGSTDAFGRPATDWAFTTGSKTYKAVDAPILTYTGKVTGGKLYTDLGKPAAASLTIKSYWDGFTSAGESAYLKGLITSGNTTAIGTAAAATYQTAVGTKTEVYKNSTNNYTVVFVNTYVGYVSGWDKADYNKDGEVTDKENIVVTALSTNGTLNTAALDTEAFEKADATDNTVVLYTRAVADETNWSNFVIKSAVAAEKVENVAVTSYTSTKVNGYTLAKQAYNTGSFTMTGGATYNLFLDAEGNVIYASTYTAGASKDYVMVVAASSTAQGDATVGDQYYNVKYLDMTGATKLIKVVNNSGLKDTAGNAVVVMDADAGTQNTDKVYTVREDEDNAGYYELVPVTTLDKTAVSTLNKTTPTIGSGIVANAETVFVLKTATGPDKYKAVTGIANIGSYTSVSAEAYAVVGDDGYADVVFLNVAAATAADTADDTVIYLLTKAGDAYDAELKKEYDLYNAIVDGVKTTVKVADGQNMASLVNKLVKINALNADGFITAANTTATLGAAYSVTSVNAEIKYSAPVLTAEAAHTLAADAVVYMIDADDELTVGTAADFVCTNANGAITYVFKSTTDFTVTAIYFDGTITE